MNCDQCSSINETIGRYEWLQSQTSDEQVRKATAELITELERRKPPCIPSRPSEGRRGLIRALMRRSQRHRHFAP